MRGFAGVTDEARRLPVQGEVARLVAPVRVGPPPASQRVWRRGSHTVRGHRLSARLRRSERPARRARNVVVRPLARGTDEARRFPVQGEVAQLMAPERIGVPPRNFRRHGPVTQPSRKGGHRSTSSPATDVATSITTSDAVVQIKTVHVAWESPIGPVGRMRPGRRSDSQDGSDCR